MNPHCVIVELQQGTPEWQEWRHRGIGSSDASIIMAENRFKSGADLLREKRGPARDFGQNEAMARGIDIEPEARSRYAAKTGRTVEPACLQSTRYDWLRASVDGLASTCVAVVEIKCGRSLSSAIPSRRIPVTFELRARLRSQSGSALQALQKSSVAFRSSMTRRDHRSYSKD
jgi:putative phage-type endonuclease